MCLGFGTVLQVNRGGLRDFGCVTEFSSGGVEEKRRQRKSKEGDACPNSVLFI